MNVWNLKFMIDAFFQPSIPINLKTEPWGLT